MEEVVVALLSQLVKAIAKVEELDEVQVSFYARNAREAGLITQRGRGRGAAHMAVTDAANLLIGVNASKLAIDVGDVIPRYRELYLNGSNADDVKRRQLRNLITFDASFGEYLEHLINLARPTHNGRSELDDTLALSVRKADEAFARRRGVSFPPPQLEIQFIRPSTEVCVMLLSPRVSENKTVVDLYELARSIYRPGEYNVGLVKPERQESTIITQRTISAVAQCLFS